MVGCSTFVFFDLETTGLPHQERNRTKIIELSFVAVTRSDIKRNNGTSVPPISKLSFVLNPEKTISSAEITGLTNDIVKYSPTFKEKFNTIKSFLEDLIKPVCLVAHNGNAFDYKILLAECADADVRLPEDLLCGDSLPYFRKIFKKTILEQKSPRPTDRPPQPQPTEIIAENEITDDEDEWPELNVTSEELQDIDDLCSSISDMSCESLDNNVPIKKTKVNKVKTKQIKVPKNYKLTEIYRTLLGREPQNAHRAEGDCIMLLQCVGVCRNLFESSDDFLSWMDDNCKRLNEIQPLIRK